MARLRSTLDERVAFSKGPVHTVATMVPDSFQGPTILAISDQVGFTRHASCHRTAYGSSACSDGCTEECAVQDITAPMYSLPNSPGIKDSVPQIAFEPPIINQITELTRWWEEDWNLGKGKTKQAAAAAEAAVQHP